MPALPLRIAACAASLLMAFSAFFVPAIPAAAQFGLEETRSAVEGQKGKVFAPDVTVAVGQIIRVALGIVGVIFLLLMIYAGFTWMTARGNEKLVARARDTLTAAIIGIIIVVGAYAITGAVLRGVTTGEIEEQPKPAEAPK